MVYAVIRVRGLINIKPDIKRTLKLLRLTRANHCVILEENPSIKGMLQVAKDYITWGEIERDTLSKLIVSRGKLKGDNVITDDYIKSSTSYNNIEKMSDAIIGNKFKYTEVPSVKPIFRLNPPVKGYEDVMDPINKLSASFHKRFDNSKIPPTNPLYQEALLYLLLSQTSCFRYWGEGLWTEYAKEICRRGLAAINKV